MDVTLFFGGHITQRHEKTRFHVTSFAIYGHHGRDSDEERRQAQEWCEFATKEPCISAREPCRSAKEPCRSAKEPCRSAKEPCRSAKESCVSDESTATHALQPCISAKGIINTCICKHMYTYIYVLDIYVYI